MKKLILPILLLLANDIIAQNSPEGKPVSVYYTYPLKDISYCNFYEFKIYENTLLENNDLKLLKDEYTNTIFFNDENSSRNFLQIKSLLSFYWEGERVVYINYDKVNGEGENENLTYASNDILNTNSIKEVTKLSNDSFWEFYNRENNPEYPEINNLKPLVKDSNGVLNIEKLAQVIEENKNDLNKYMNN